ncbi:uncharacterized protein LOC114276627 isoform X3 [Camellia sinensis]|uniref:uncharacterized protein LOC114276627 isoform X3 n=1 Tax=Camellia sinensis TaxID=4442 RepID=UPI0010356539|nr:uncharacterized protein LOC114276627 isoform X3 [Camellia sinensis]
MDKLTLQLPSGIASFCHRYPPANWRQFANIFLKTEESLVDYAKFCSSVMDIYSSLVVSTASENEVSFGWICGEDLNYFKRYYFNAFVLSSGPMQHDTRLVDMISGGFEGLSLPKGTRLDHLLWDSDFDEIFQRLKSEKKWSEFSDVSLKTALIEHFSLLHKLNDNLDISVGNMSEISSQGDSILEAITKDYSEELSRLTKGIAEVRMKNYVDHLEFKSLVNKCAAQAKALSTEVIAKDCALNPQKLFRLKDRAMTAESWMLEKFSRLKGRVRGNYVGPFTRGVPAFLLLAALSVAALGTLEDRKA